MTNEEGFSGLQKAAIGVTFGGLAGLLLQGTEYSSNSHFMNHVERYVDNINSSQSVPYAVGSGLVLGAIVLAPYLVYQACKKKK